MVQDQEDHVGMINSLTYSITWVSRPQKLIGDPNPNHVNESLLSEVDWGAHNPDADDPEQLTGESIQSFLTFVVQLQWLVGLGRLYLHKSLPCPILW